MLRPYQDDACDEAAKQIAKGHHKPLVISPTSSGKSFMIAGICQRAVAKGNRVLVLCHQGEILEQNEEKLNLIDLGIKTGIYCASTGRRDTGGDVIFASRDSLGRRLDSLGTFSLVVVDEAHLVSTNEKTRYQKIFKAVQAKYIVGFTGTPWRLDNGQIWGHKGFFDTVAYNISLDFLISQGFIVPYEFATDNQIINTDGVRIKSTGDFDEQELSDVSSTEEVVKACIDKWEEIASERKTSIFFCCSLAHAEVVTEELRERLGTDNVGYIDGKTNKKDRKELFRLAKEGYYRALVNVGVLTTGVDCPIIDCVVMLRATKSAALWVQAIGRGLRVYPGKENLLILDLTDNLDRFQSLSAPLAPEGSEPREEKGLIKSDGPKKYCPECQFEMAPAKTVCPYCGHIFISHGVRLAGIKDEKGWFQVDNYSWQYDLTKNGDTCVVVSFKLKDIRTHVKQWLMFKRNDGWGRKHLGMVEQLKQSKVIALYVADSRTKSYPKVTAYKLSGEPPIESANNENLELDHSWMYAR